PAPAEGLRPGDQLVDVRQPVLQIGLAAALQMGAVVEPLHQLLDHGGRFLGAARAQPQDESSELPDGLGRASRKPPRRRVGGQRHRIATGLLRRGVGEKTLEEWLHAAQHAGRDPVALAADTPSGRLPGRAAKAIGEFAALVLRLRTRSGEEPAPVIEELVERLDYRGHLQSRNEPDLEDRLAHVDELIAGAQAFSRRRPGGTLAEYVSELSLLAQIDTANVSAGAVNLMTVHNAKGLEFDHVYMSGLEEGLFPHMSAYREDREMEEERRLFYVACTRARHRLHLSAARDRRRTNRPSERGVSQFVAQIPEQLLDISAPAEEVWTEPSTPASGGRIHSGDWYADDDEEVITYDDPLVGRRVEHPTFGEGWVLHVEGDRSGAACTVQFPRAGQKKIVRKFLKLLD
ncbi:MAG: hypothetical protein GF355_10170, partial [Candidatus Eisenbacteria bacterium]|nr:hypothetical protein [Candidatus Eisenbacteria bacterium]